MSEEENIYQKLAQATARAVDIQLGKTTLAELLDGYTKYIVLQGRILKAIEYIGNGNLGIPRKTREKFIKILKGEENESN